MKLSTKHQNPQSVTYNSFSGGLNLAGAAELIAQNELARAINVEIDKPTGLLKTCSGTEDVFVASNMSFNYLMWDSIGETLLVTDTDGKLYKVTTDGLVEIGTLSGSDPVEYIGWEDGIIITSGGYIQYYHDGVLETIANSWENNADCWQKVTPSAWQPSTSYTTDDIVTYLNSNYLCKDDHTSSSGVETTYVETSILDDKKYWSKRSYDTWDYETSYDVGDVVVNEDGSYVCTKAHKSTAETVTVNNSFNTDSSYWVRETPNWWILFTAEYNLKIPSWGYNTYYHAGKYVQVGNYYYRCTTAHTSCPSTTTVYKTFSNDSAYWSKIEEWAYSTPYEKGQYVTWQLYVYKCKTTHTSIPKGEPVTITGGLTELDADHWQSIDVTEWDANTSYSTRSFVYHDYELYECITAQNASGSSPSNTHTPFVKNGRVWVSIGDELHCSAVGDETNWLNDSNDPSSSQWLQIGYKDGGTITGVSSLSSDTVIFKDNNRAYHLAGTYPNWTLTEIGRNIDCKSLGNAVTLAEMTLCLGADRFQAIMTTDEYGDMKAKTISLKVTDYLSTISKTSRVRFLPSLNQVWFLDSSTQFMFYDVDCGGFFERRFNSEVVDALNTEDTVYILKSNKIQVLTSKQMSDDGIPMLWRIQGKSLVSNNDILVKRLYADVTPLSDEFYSTKFKADRISLNGAIPLKNTVVKDDDTIVMESTRPVYNEDVTQLGNNSDDVYANPDYIYENEDKIWAKEVYRSQIRQIERKNAIKIYAYGEGGIQLINSITIDYAIV